ncbi:MAG TPA: 16S rRNA (guanine(527)-N(7))-methyltransferase RsmG, partial [Solirubrobacteraceae bacterium]
RTAERILDLGAGAGLPGLPLAIARPSADVTLLESSSRKGRFIERAIETCRVTNARVVQARAESFDAGRDRYDVITARAVAPLAVTLEYAAPLLRLGGSVVAWRGQRDAGAERAASQAAAELGLGEPAVLAVHPYPGARNRHLFVAQKTRETPSRFPRRPGVALKRPLGAGWHSPRASSDRVQR